MPSPSLRVTYTLHGPHAEAAARAEAILLEQTVELSRHAVAARKPATDCLGTLVAVREIAEGLSEAVIDQPWDTTAEDVAQLLNVLFGNTSLQPGVEVADVLLPAEARKRFPGPRFGIGGWRRLTGAGNRALTCAALKPMGLSVEQLAELAGAYAEAGIDVIKDDHGLADHAFAGFEARVCAVMQTLKAVAQRTGRSTLYAPNLIGGPEAVAQQARSAARHGAGAVLISPMLIGLPVFEALVREVQLPVLAHPAFGGAARVSPKALLGTLFPLCGADAVIFPNYGGRFTYSEALCVELAERLRVPVPADAKASLPVPAGGLKLERVPSVLARYGTDVMLLMGGGLLEAETLAGVRDRSRQLVEAVALASRS